MATKSYSIEQYPKNKGIDDAKLSIDQRLIRTNKKKYKYGANYTCVQCCREQPIKEFYIKDKETGRRDRTCRDCRMKNSGVVEIGKQRFSDLIGKKGFRRCSVCKNIKPLNEYAKQKGNYLGHASNCKECNSKAVKELQIRGRKNITDWYVREYGKRKGIIEFDKPIIDELRKEIIESRQPKYFLDGMEFGNIMEFARYVESQYGLPATMTEKRIHQGKTEQECTLSEFEMRSRAYTKGQITVTDTVTKEVFKFTNTRDPELLKMFSKSSVVNCIRTGKPTRVIKTSKYKNQCIIKRG